MIVRPGWHETCRTHKSYALSCEEFEALMAITPGLCNMCSQPLKILNIDHDHDLGRWAVRGILCSKCNRELGLIETSWSKPTEDSTRYLAAAWHLQQDTSAKQSRQRR